MLSTLVLTLKGLRIFYHIESLQVKYFLVRLPYRSGMKKIKKSFIRSSGIILSLNYDLIFKRHDG